MIVPVGQHPPVVAVVPTLGSNLGRLERCVASIGSSTGGTPVGVIVVWNSLEPAPHELIGATVLTPGLNLGFPGSLNHGRSRMNPDYLWVIQDDLTVREGCLEAMLGHLESDQTLGVVAPLTLDPDGRVAHPRAATLTGDWEFVGYPATGVHPLDVNPNEPLDFVFSSGSLVRIAAWDAVGGYDPRFYPLYWSDVDFCFRVRRAGWTIALTADAVIDHEQHGSADSLLQRYFMAVNKQRFIDKQRAGGDLRSDPPSLDVDPDLLAQVAVEATTQLVGFSRFASGNLERLTLRWRIRHPSGSLKAVILAIPPTRWMVARVLAIVRR